MASWANITTSESAGPLTGVHAGNLVETPRGLRPLDLEGFSEDLDEDGQVDPLVSVQSVTAPAAAAVATPFAHALTATAALPAAVGYVRHPRFRMWFHLTCIWSAYSVPTFFPI